MADEGKLLLLTLYRQLIRSARVYPSANRVSMVRQIRKDFKQNRTLTKPKDIAAAVEEGINALNNLHQYTKLDGEASHLDLSPTGLKVRPRADRRTSADSPSADQHPQAGSEKPDKDNRSSSGRILYGEQSKRRF